MSDKEIFLRNMARPVEFKSAESTSQTQAHPAKSLGVAGLEGWKGLEAALERLSKLEISPGELSSARYAGADLFLFLFLSSKEPGPLRGLLRSELKQLLSETPESPASAPPSSPGVL